MATNKADIISQVNNSLPSGTGGILASSHRLVLHTSPDSVLEAIYSDHINETELINTATVPNSKFTYTVQIFKVGSNITITGTFTALFTVIPTLGTPEIFTISDTNYSCVSQKFYTYATRLGGDTIKIAMIDNVLQVENLVVQGESFDFTITYKALN